MEKRVDKSRYLEKISLWKILRVISIVTIIWVTYSVALEAYALNKVFVWLKDRILELTWEAPKSDCDHYRLEISNTDLLAEPVKTSLHYAYTENTNYQIELQNDHSYMFRVQGVDFFGTLSDFSDSTSLFIYEGSEAAKQVLTKDITPMEFSLSQNYPNPFNSQTTIEYQIPDSGTGGSGVTVNLTIYNLLGQRVKVLVDENQMAGNYYKVWDGRDNDGREVGSGNYIYLLTAEKSRISKKMVYLK